ncbi:MAG TPA: helix-turn-helix domain-containing protein [Polyangiaceae bacterium]|nr:helix-turn-helix domain-containing protein [Polyangiaceae bacterium]
MALREFMQAHRNEILEAYRMDCEREPRERLAEYVQGYFAELAQSVTPKLSNELLLVGDSSAMSHLRTRVDQLSRRSRAPVLIYGEAGSGRRHLARALHTSTWPDGEWVELDDSLPVEALDAKLAMLRKNTAAVADVGLTAYTHELTRSSAQTQEQLVRLLDEQRLPVRVITSSSCALAEPVREGRLRRDLLFRFSNELKLPALGERKEDIAPLARHFADLSAARRGVGSTQFSSGALARMLEYPWPGSTKELCALVERVCDEHGAGVVQAEDLPALGERASGEVFTLPATGIDLAVLERQLLVQALLAVEHNQTRAASLLGLTRDQIRYRMAKFGLLSLNGRENGPRSASGRQG